MFPFLTTNQLTGFYMRATLVFNGLMVNNYINSKLLLLLSLLLLLLLIYLQVFCILHYKCSLDQTGTRCDHIVALGLFSFLGPATLLMYFNKIILILIKIGFYLILFNTFLCDLFLIMENIDIASYADDNTPYTTGNSIEEEFKN